MADDGRVVVHIDGDDSGLQNSLNNANQAIQAASSQMSQSANAAAASVNGMNSAFSSVNGAASSAASAASSASSAIGAAASGTQTASDAAVDYSGALAQMQSTMSQAVSVLGNMDSTLSEVSEGLQQTANETENTDGILQKLGGTIKTVFSIALIKEFAQAVYDVGSSFEYSLSKVSSIADTTALSIGEISDQVLRLSSDTGTAASEINEAVYQAISAGVDTADAVSTVEVAVKSAKAGFTDTATAIDGLTTVINSFKTANLEADEVANKFLITQNLGKTSFGELASAIGNVAPTANAAGVSIDELLAATASLTANGIATSQAMTGLKAAMSNIITPSSNAKKMADELGIQFDAAALKSKGLTGMMKEIAEATQGDTEKMAQLFGSVEALNTMLTLTSEGGAELFDKTMSEMATNTTALDDAFDTMTDNVQAKTDIMKTAAENFGIAIYDSISGGLGDSIVTVTDYINRLHDAFTEGGLSQLGGELFQIAFDAIEDLGNGIAQALPELIPEALQTVITIADTIIDNVDKVIDTAEALIQGLADGLLNPKTLDILLTKAPEVVVKLVDAFIRADVDIVRFAIDFCDKCAEALVDYDWSEAARQTIENLADALDEAQRYVAVTLDNIFSGGELYGGDTANVRIGSDIFLSAESIREGADEVVNAIDNAENSIRTAYERGKNELDDTFGNDRTTLNLETQASVMNGYAENARNAAERAAQSYHAVGDAAEDSAQIVEDTAEVTEKASDKVSEEFKAFYENLKLEKAMGSISDEEYISRLSEMLNSSAEYASAAYTKYWQEVTSANSKAKTKAQDKISEDFKSFYDNLKLQLAEGKITKEEYIEQLREMLSGSAEYDDIKYTSYWNEVRNADEKAAREAAQDRKKIEDQRKRDQEKADKEELARQKKSAQRELQQLKSDISELQSEYKENLTKLTSERDKFKDKLSANILSTSKEKITDKRTGQTTTKKTDTVADIKKKIEARKKLGSALESLVKKGIPKNLLSELAGMDPEDALRFAEQLDKMDSDKWKKIVDSYNEYEEINSKIANDIYGPQITALNQQFANDMSTLLDGVNGEAAEKGSEMISAYISGIDMSSDDAMSDIKKFADDVVKQLNDAVTDSELVNGKMELALDNVDGVDAGEDIADQIADGIDNNSTAISTAVENAVSEGMSDITAAVDIKTSAISQNVSASVPTAFQAEQEQEPVREIRTEKIIYRDVKLVWKDGRALAEIVDTENKIIGMQGGNTGG